MQTRILHILGKYSADKILFGILGILIFLASLLAMYFNSVFLLGLPILFFLVLFCIVDYEKVFLLLIFCLPLSTEFYLPGGFGTDLPSEPLMVGLMLIYFVYSLNRKQIDTAFWSHPITILLCIHVLWIFICTLTSSLWWVSLKYSLAKLWYVVVFYFLAGQIIRKPGYFKILFWAFFIPLLFTVLIILWKHAGYGYSFKDVYKVLHPFYRNHVAYACIITLFFPFVFFAIRWYKPFSMIWWGLVLTLPIFLVAIYYSYTRAAYVALFIAILFYVIIRLRLVKYVLAFTILVSVSGIAYVVHENTYLEFAPNYDKTITHTEFENLIEATYNLEDISTMERVYRWVAGIFMFTEKPVFGFGPGNFVNFYKSYTITAFKTYVSRNEDQSGIHSYFLMTLVEQGAIGLIIFLVLIFFVLIRGETVYYKLKSSENKQILMTVMLSTIVIDAFLIINDMVEVDKVGPIFFISMATIVNLENSMKKK